MTIAHPFLVRADEGQYVWRLGAMMRLLAGGEQTGGQFWLSELTAPQGSGAGTHLHTREDETFMVAEGELTVRVGDQTLELGPGDVAYGPRNLSHSYRVESPTARFHVLGTPAGFENWFFETGTRVDDPSSFPPPGFVEEFPDPATLVASLVKYGAKVL
ncbi:quercetin 2,3-dioxygenase [Streptomyces sp. GMY02]|uniref:quercetin 2,3-dioxygenase n=1 Tax=Streptomyces sp. GMY02 TaxID=1333528 RepID=UPI001C2BF404|nr:quercetin 2,3-dioxygenase [Streptomyces sp. GMY02]QXE38662.1 quercetin 2,3-dioxygenase [Streptomyces sp. GMY02]